MLATEGPLLLLAGAGSGKTTVLIHRIANLMKYGRGLRQSGGPQWVTGDDPDLLEGIRRHGAGDRERQERLCRLDPAVPWSILAITFTNKAAGELKDRLAALLGPGAEDIWASTFHLPVCASCAGTSSGWASPPSFTIYDTDDSPAGHQGLPEGPGSGREAVPAPDGAGLSLPGQGRHEAGWPVSVGV